MDVRIFINELTSKILHLLEGEKDCTLEEQVVIPADSRVELLSIPALNYPSKRVSVVAQELRKVPQDDHAQEDKDAHDEPDDSQDDNSSEADTLDSVWKDTQKPDIPIHATETSKPDVKTTETKKPATKTKKQKPEAATPVTKKQEAVKPQTPPARNTAKLKKLKGNMRDGTMYVTKLTCLFICRSPNDATK